MDQLCAASQFLFPLHKNGTDYTTKDHISVFFFGLGIFQGPFTEYSDCYIFTTFLLVHFQIFWLVFHLP